MPWKACIDLTSSRITLTGNLGPLSQSDNSLKISYGFSTVTVRPGNGGVIVDCSQMLVGDVYCMQDEKSLQLSNSVDQLAPSPETTDLDLSVLIAMCSGRRPAPGRTHIRGLWRLPPLSMTAVNQDGLRIRYSGALAGDHDRTKVTTCTGVADLLMQNLTSATNPDNPPLVVGTGDLASSALINILGERNFPVTHTDVDLDHDIIRAERTSASHTRPTAAASWPSFSGHHKATRTAIELAAQSGQTDVITPDHLHSLLSCAPDELRSTPRELRAAEPLAHAAGEKRNARKDAEDATHAHADGPRWLTEEWSHRLEAKQVASRAEWSEWASDVSARNLRILWALTDPTIAFISAAANQAGIKVHRPAVDGPGFEGLLCLAPDTRGRFNGGRFISDALLLSLARKPSARADEAARVRAAAAAWAARSQAELSSFAETSSLVINGVIDGELFAKEMANPFLRTEQALQAKQLLELEAWLTGLVEA